MTQAEKEFWTRCRALLIEQEKALTEQRAAIIGQRKAIEAMLGTDKTEAHEPTDNEILTARITYTA